MINISNVYDSLNCFENDIGIVLSQIGHDISTTNACSRIYYSSEMRDTTGNSKRLCPLRIQSAIAPKITISKIGPA